ncbi:DUF1569 domain-containing protein [Flavihumibacter rivuli]|uniref:DUF1569 domain-containing protein n=1 Tax=Flavihumibacter rivuli TaxID=2838156 RepID=UPI001BDE81F5|nr:DUF1569 domain-containing protein [Flavihumibacter rivuli]ULQ55897.1 DUF1569 domain-containing protein [Flavihumibacter rivuli]
MHSIFQKDDREAIIHRIQSLNKYSKPKWGVMSVGQMLRHCSLCEDYYYGLVPVKRSLLGRLIGRMVLNKIIKDDQAQLGRNAPTSATFIIRETVDDIESEKNRWINCILRYADYPFSSFRHWFFGPMSKEELGIFVYKHCDHHLRQFGR